MYLQISAGKIVLLSMPQSTQSLILWCFFFRFATWPCSINFIRIKRLKCRRPIWRCFDTRTCEWFCLCWWYWYGRLADKSNTSKQLLLHISLMFFLFYLFYRAASMPQFLYLYRTSNAWDKWNKVKLSEKWRFTDKICTENSIFIIVVC